MQPERTLSFPTDRRAREETDADPSPSPRKVQRRVAWTDAEKQAIINGVHRVGSGRWSEILQLYAHVFAVNNRDSGGIRDQYRAMCNNGDAAERLLRAAQEDDALGSPVSETPQAPTQHLAHPTPSPTHDVPAPVAPAPDPSSFNEPLADELGHTVVLSPSASQATASTSAVKHVPIPSSNDAEASSPAARVFTGRTDTWFPQDIETLVNGVTEYGRDWKAIAADFPFIKKYTHIQVNEKWKTLKKRANRRDKLSPEERNLLDRVEAADKAQESKKNQRRAEKQEANHQKVDAIMRACGLQRHGHEKQKGADAAPLHNNTTLVRVAAPQQVYRRPAPEAPEQQLEQQLQPPHHNPPVAVSKPKRVHQGRKDSWSRKDVEQLVDAVLNHGHDWTKIATTVRFKSPYDATQLRNKWQTMKKWVERYHHGELSEEDSKLYEQVAAADALHLETKSGERAKHMEKVRKWIEAKRLGLPPQRLPSALVADLKIKIPQSDYRGVSWSSHRSRWRMRLQKKLGTLAESYHDSEDDAARAYNAALRSALEDGIAFQRVEFNVIKADEERTDATGNNEVSVAPARRPDPALTALPPAEVKLMEQHKPTDVVDSDPDPDSDIVDIPDLGLGMYDSDDADDSDLDPNAEGDGGGNDRSTR